MVLALYPATAEKTFLLREFDETLDPFEKDITDPIGGSYEIYQNCRDQIEQGIASMLKFLDQSSGVRARTATGKVSVALGADHGGFELKETLKEHLQARGVAVTESAAATPPITASATMRPILAAGSRRSERALRDHSARGDTSPTPDPRGGSLGCGGAPTAVPVSRLRRRVGPHGRARSDSERSCRRSRTTVRRSCTVAAKRSCVTSAARRVSGSRRSRPTNAPALALRIAREWRPGTTFPTGRMFDRDGFIGLDGAFRFADNGVAERALEVREVRANGVTVVSPAPTAFGN